MEPRLGDRQSLPIFITEFGYGMLAPGAADTVAGRVRQWRWFKAITPQIETLGIEGPMAFLLRPYLERRWNEFGLTSTVPGPFFTPRDFDSEKSELWMNEIGKNVGPGFATPAFAYLADYGKRHPYVSRSWGVRAPPPSPVVIDFVAGSHLHQLKSWSGYELDVGGGDESGEIRVYNFSGKTVLGRLSLNQKWTQLILEPEEMRMFPVTINVPSDPSGGQPWEANFYSDDPSQSESRFSTEFYSHLSELRRVIVENFDDFSRPADRHRRLLMARPVAEEEPSLQNNGRWLVTTGVNVNESPEGWRFDIERLPESSMRPAVAELPLSDGLAMPSDYLLRFDFRCGFEGTDSSRYAGFSSTIGGLIQFQVRTANGNLYEVWPRRAPTASWQTYEERISNFTMSFYGRAALPWRFRDNEPVALVFTFWPRSLPTRINVRSVMVARLEKP